MAWTVYLTKTPRYPAMWVPVPHLGVTLQRPLEFAQVGIVYEVFDVVDIVPGELLVKARYRGLQRGRELPRRFDPSRLPQ